MEIRTRMERLKAEILAGAPFRVLGLASPGLSPAILAEFAQADGAVEHVGLMFGRP